MADPGPHVGVGFLEDFLGEFFAVGAVVEDGEEGGAGAGHGGSGDAFGGEEFAFEDGEEEVFLEDGAFEVVGEFDAVDFLFGVGDVRKFFGVVPLFVGVFGGDVEVGFEEDDVALPFEFGGFDVGSASAAPAGFIVEEEGDVGAEGGAEFEEFFEWDGFVVEGVEAEEGGRGVAGTAAESGAVGDGFFEVDLVGDFGFGFLFEETDGAGDEVGAVGGDAFLVAGEREGVRLFEGEFVGESAEGGHEGFDFVETVATFAEDAEGEVDFCGSFDEHGD